MDPLISIAALIYASPRHAQHLWQNLRATTPELETGQAEFFFVANDATDEVLEHLDREQIPHIVQTNPRLTERELVKLGIGRPEYIRRVYQGWNRAIASAQTDCVVLLNSDHVMRPGWLAELYTRWTSDTLLSPLTIEPRGRYGVFPATLGGGTGAVLGEHGRTLDSFDAAGFEKHASGIATDRWTPGGAFMPVLMSKTVVTEAGLYPEGNLHGGRFDRIKEYGDRHLFRILAERGVRHYTYHGVVAYHFGEGEMRETA